MAESTLSPTWTTLMQEIGYFLGYGRDSNPATPAIWTAAQKVEIQAILDSGLRQFYGAYDWSFLKPTTTLDVWTSVAVNASATVAATGTTMTLTPGTTGIRFYPSMVGKTVTVTDIGSRTIAAYTSSTVVTIDTTFATSHTFSITADGTYRMPDDFGYLMGPITYLVNEGEGELEVVGEQFIREIRQAGSVTAAPSHVAIRPVASTGTGGQRWEAYVWPDTDQYYSLPYRYCSNPYALSSSLLYPLGGMWHGETILECCLSVAEQRMDDDIAVHTERYNKICLPVSIERDKKLSPEYYGYNGDDDGAARDYPRVKTLTILYNGVQY